MATFSKFLSLIAGADRTVDLSLSGNALGVSDLQLLGSTSGTLDMVASATTTNYSLTWPAAQGGVSTYLKNDGSGNLTWATVAAGGVTSIAFADDSSTPIYTVSGSPVTSTGTLAITLTTQLANTVFAGPASGSAAQPGFRALVSADIPNNAANTTGTASNVTATSNSTLTTLSALSLPYSQVTGGPSTNAITALTGDGTASGPGSVAFTLATVNSNVGTFASVTVNGKGLVTAAANLSGDVTTSGSVSSLVATSNSTLTTLSALTTASALAISGSQVSGGTFGAVNGSALTNLSAAALSGVLPVGVTGGSGLSIATSQLTGDISLTSQVSGILPIANGGTNASSAANAFINLSPLTTAGDLIFENNTPAPARLPIGSSGQVLTVVAGLPAWAASAISPGSITLTQNHVLVGNASNFAADVAMSGDASIVASGALTLATVNSNVGTFGDSSDVAVVTVNGKGLVTAVSTASITAPAGALTGTALNSSVVSSSLASLGIQGQALNMGSHQINAVANGTLTTDAINLGQLQSAISGLYWQGPAQAYAASNVPLTGGATLTVDSYPVQNGDLVILGNQTTASQNGEYTASGIGSAYVLTPNGLPSAAGDAWLILNGTNYGDSAFVANAAVPAATFTEFAGPTAYTFSAPLLLTGRTVSITQSNTSTNGYLSSTDWNTFNNKQTAGNYITALTGDATASGPGSVAITLATVNSNVGSFGSSTSIPSFTVNAKGLITAASGNAVVAPAGTLSGTVLNSTVVSSSLTSVGTISSGTWQGTAVAIGFGGTGQATKQAGFNALSPLATAGDTLYYNGSNNVSLGIGSTGQVLTVVGGEPAWATPATSGTVTSVALSVPATSIFSVSGSPVTSSGTLSLLTTGTSGGIPYFSSTSALSSSALLAASQLVIGGGAGTAPSTLAAGSQYQVLTMGASNPGYGAVNLAQSAAVTGVLPSANVGLDRTINAQTGTTYTFALADGSAAGGNPLVTANNSSTQTYTVPLNSSVAFPVGTQIDLIQEGPGAVTIAAAGGVTINSEDVGLTLSGQYAAASLIQTATNVWTLIAGAPAGTVTSVAFADNSTAPIYSVSGSPVTSSGTLAITLATQSANTIFAGPSSGSAAQPSFRALVSADIPNNAANTSGTAANITATSNSTLTTLSALTTASALSSVGTITSGTWNGTTIAIAHGGTGQVTAAAAYNALSPMTTTGDIEYEASANTAARLAIGSTGQVLTVVGGIPTWASPATSGTVTSVSVATANGFAGTVATATSTPAITIETSITGILQGNGTAISAATTTGTGSVVLSASPTLTGTVLASNVTLSGNLVAPTIEVTAVYGGATTLTANTTYAMRWGMPSNSETAGKLYVADWSTSSFDLFWCVGLYNSNSSTSTGATITIVQKGEITLGSSDAAFGSSDQGRPVYLGSAGAFIPYSSFSPSAGDANMKLGVAQSASIIWVDFQMMGVS